MISEHWSVFQEQNHHKISKKSAVFSKKIAEKSIFILPVTENLISGLQKLGIKTYESGRKCSRYRFVFKI